MQKYSVANPKASRPIKSFKLSGVNKPIAPTGCAVEPRLRFTTNAFGAFSAQFVVPKKIAEPYHLDVFARTNEQIAFLDVPISEYRPVEFDVRVRGPKTVVAGEKATFEVEGNYLYGDPMRGALVDYSTNYEDQTFVPPNTQTHTTSASELRHYGEFSKKDSSHVPRQTLHLEQSQLGDG
jgi:uncharacterized protein YfaS (alpha-2-macroglobulin family)